MLNNPSPAQPAVKAAFFDMDDAIGQLADAAEVIEALTEGTIANKATAPLHEQIQRLRAIMKAAWPVAVAA